MLLTEVYGDSQMSIDWGVVMGFDNHPFVVSSTCNHPLTTFVPGSMDVLELMQVDPWFEYVLILFIYQVVDGSGVGMEESSL